MYRTPFSVPLASPLHTARGELTQREGFLVGLDPAAHDVPRRGVGEAAPLPGWTESLGACEEALERDAGGETATNGTPTNGTPTSGTPRGGTAPPPAATPAACHAVSQARLDAASRDAGLPLAAFLADRFDLPEPAGTVPVNATVGDAPPAETATEAARAAEAGFPAVKVKVGARDLDADLDRLRAVREAVGPEVEIRADANAAWDAPTARRALEAMAAPAIDLAYVEQPLAPDDLAGHARLRTQSAVGVALDESVAARGVDAVLEAAAADVLVCKPMALGGPERTLATAMRARDRGVEPVVTTTIDAVVARTAAVHVAAAIPDVAACGLATGSLLTQDLAPDPAPVEAGAVSVPAEPGTAGEAFDDLLF